VLTDVREVFVVVLRSMNATMIGRV